MSLEDLERRLAAVERLVADEAGLRAAVDRDQADQGSKIKATHRLVQALSITQAEHTDKLERLQADVTEIRAGQSAIIDLLNELIRREG